MRNFLKISFYGTAVSLLLSCGNKTTFITVPIDKIDENGVSFRYSHLDSTYVGKFSLDVTEKNFYETDSLKIKISNSYPPKLSFVSVVKKSFKNEEVLIGENLFNRSIYSYHSVDVKPLFNKIESAHKNDSAIYNYFKNYFKNSDDTNQIDIYIVVDGKGKAHYKSSRMQDESIEDQVIMAINRMPSFSSPRHNGDTVSVVYLITIPVPW
jgi:hypothetical protein